MKTLIIVSHPTIETSLNQQFFKEASIHLSATWHHLEACYPDGKIDLQTELALLKEHDRIIFQFPFYWYSAPAHLKMWQDQVLESATKVLLGKELGIVLTTGVSEKEYQAGGKEEYTISEFLRPYQRIAHKFQMTFLPPFVLAQFMYLTEEQRFERLISYQQYLSLVEKPSLINRIDWFIERFAQNEIIKEKEPAKQQMIGDMLEEAKENIEDLTFILQEMKGRSL
ncbi:MULTISPECIES: NAD(P)H-dependent oxidoreductase [Enterococcus]|uniref:NAD(P)H dehydrogenase n=1 Tax=Candidatus Enterococcus mangumiae TaxID=2230878 RepID=A0ABZ2T0I3_9ENTE|nr:MULTISPECIES: NAD(P)H-dependent oxidoreductase [unclassified Enterococcus]MBO0489652.1 NAD(P)H-dependent oxidoreductase [Enterococcus sp. DIV1094]MBO1298469.1 NAD(P)H-dependent oxidoreductase [Enterococcus sp. DIV1271a]